MKDLFNRILSRCEVVKWWFLGIKNNVSFKELLQFLISPTCSMKAKQYIKRICSNENYKIIYMKNLDIPIYYPKKINIHSLLSNNC